MIRLKYSIYTGCLTLTSNISELQQFREKYFKQKLFNSKGDIRQYDIVMFTDGAIFEIFKRESWAKWDTLYINVFKILYLVFLSKLTRAVWY